jgi:hypothetical protein
MGAPFVKVVCTLESIALKIFMVKGKSWQDNLAPKTGECVIYKH